MSNGVWKNEERFEKPESNKRLFVVLSLIDRWVFRQTARSENNLQRETKKKIILSIYQPAGL